MFVFSKTFRNTLDVKGPTKKPLFCPTVHILGHHVKPGNVLLFAHGDQMLSRIRQDVIVDLQKGRELVAESHSCCNMRGCWWIYRTLSRLVMAPERYPQESLSNGSLSNLEERRHFRELMQDKPRHWGRFVAYVDRLDQHYPPDESYRHIRDAQEAMPQLVPRILVFVIQYFIYLVTRACCRRLDSVHGSCKKQEEERTNEEEEEEEED